MTTIQPWIEFGTGLLTGGLGLSTCWGLFWFVIGLVGFIRGTCNRQVLLSGLAAAGVPLLMLAVLAWLKGGAQGPGLPFIGGLSILPLVLVGLALRRAPDGQLAGARMLSGVRHLMEKLLGKHRACGGCGDEHGRGPGGCE